jgi:hypothetical protein
MGFTASDIRSHDLAFDFSTYEGANGQPWGIRGTVPEPTAETRDAFLTAIATAYSLDGGDEQELAASFQKLSPEAKAKSLSTLRSAVVGLCSGSPPKEVLDALPFPLFDAFQAWLMDELFVAPPTQPSAASSDLPVIEGAAVSPITSVAISA